MRALTMEETFWVVGGQSSGGSQGGGSQGGGSQGGGSQGGGGQELPGGGYPGSGEDVGLGEFLGWALDNPGSFLGEVVDNVYEWFRDQPDPSELGPPDENGVRRSPDGTRVQFPVDRQPEAQPN
jgi:hypothetical protein